VELQTARLSDVKSSSPPSEGLFTGKIEDYSLGKVLGQGAYAVVRIGTHLVTAERVAVKIYEKYRLTDSAKKRNVKREAIIMMKLSHTHIIKLLNSIESTRQIHFVMEYVGGSSLYSYLKRRSSRRLDEAEAKRLLRQLLEALDYCHSSEITHRDIKLENVLLDEHNNVKLIDFGFSTDMPTGCKSKTFCGTPSYMAPEIVAHKEYLGPPVDIWAVGVLLFAMTAGTFPFKGISDKDLYRKIIKGSFEVPDCVPSTAKSLIRLMLQVDPLRRPSCKELLAEAWFSESRSSEAPREELSAPLTERLFVEAGRAESRGVERPLSVITPKYASRTPSYLGLTQREKENKARRVY
jgi:MAP/microtubule affinity-regulating kinase